MSRFFLFFNKNSHTFLTKSKDLAMLCTDLREDIKVNIKHNRGRVRDNSQTQLWFHPLNVIARLGTRH